MTFKKYGIGLAVAAALGVAGSAQAVMIDDMAYTGAPVNGQAVDTTADGNGVYNNPTIGAASRGTGGSGAWVVGGSRTGQLYANLISGDRTSTDDCPTCTVSHTTDQSSSTSHNFLLWQGTDINLSAGESVAFDVETDIAGGDFFITLSNNGGAVAQHQWTDVVQTGLTDLPTLGRPLLHATTLSFMPGAVTFDELRLDIISAGGSTYTDPTGLIVAGTNFGGSAIGLDTNIANLRTTEVPEPTTLAMLGLGLAGLGWQRRRKSA